MAKTKFKNDKYKKNRGGYSRLLEIKCEGCNAFVCFYQKDGPGMLKRMYLDRIYRSKYYSGLANLSLTRLPKFICKKCGRILGIPIIYKKEERLAFRLFQGSIIKKIVKTFLI